MPGLEIKYMPQPADQRNCKFIMIRSAILLIFGAAALLAAGDAEGCRDLKLFPRAGSCIIIECGSKVRDAIDFQTGADQKKAVEGASATLKYQCPAAMEPEQVANDMLPVFKKAGFGVVYQDFEDPMGALITARKGDRWMELFATREDDGPVYSLTVLETGTLKLAAGEACSELGLYALPKGCAISECSAKSSESMEFRTGAETQSAVQGSRRSTAIACPAALTPAQMFDASKSGLRAAGVEIVFEDVQKLDYSWLTGRSAGRWIELMSFQDGEAIAYQLTAIQPEGTPPTAAGPRRDAAGQK